MIINMKAGATASHWEAVFGQIRSLGRAYRVIGLRSIAVEEGERGEIDTGLFRDYTGVESVCSMKIELPSNQVA